jgi:signal transduction histidine kinase
VIRAEAELALRRVREPESYRESLHSIQAEAVHLEKLLDSLLMIARSEPRDLELKYIDVSQLARQAVTRMERFAISKEIRVTSDISDEAWVLGDPEQFERIVEALLHNAVKFGRQGGSVELGVSSSRREVNVVVRDDGPGFSDEARAHAFDRFWRGSTVDGKGSGLGLTIAKTAVERWGGQIRISNAAEGGGQISIVLPASASVD